MMYGGSHWFWITETTTQKTLTLLETACGIADVIPSRRGGQASRSARIVYVGEY
jgi:hypothetical protein